MSPPKKTLLFNPVGLVHYRNIGLFKERLNSWDIKSIINPKFTWFKKNRNGREDTIYFEKNRVPVCAFDNVKAVVCFSAQVRIPPLMLFQEAAFRSIPVIAIEEGYQMMLEQGFVSEYVLPVDHLFVGSNFERERFLEIGVPKDVVETTGCMFRYRSRKDDKPFDRDKLKKRLAIPKGKPVATLILAYITRCGETLDIRKQLLSLVYRGLPGEFQLLVKPHPTEHGNKINNFIKKYAPNAIVADKFTPIDQILKITDLVINRGNSQVIIEALQANIPVIVVPVDRQTLFHGLIDEVVLNGNVSISEILERINQKGMAIYNQIFEKYLYITPEESLNSIISRIDQIAAKNTIYKPEEKLIELALFWASIGYASQSHKTLSETSKHFEINKLLFEKIGKLISCRADHDDLKHLKKWNSSLYRKWIIQSLWIKNLYMSDKKMTEEDKDWLRDYPPRLNRQFYLPFAYMLCWSYMKSGMNSLCEQTAYKICEEFGDTKESHSILRVAKSKIKLYNDIKYLESLFRYKLNVKLRSLYYMKTLKLF